MAEAGAGQAPDVANIPLRSLLYVPGHKRDWVAKAIKTGCDGLVLDLEDSVPADGKAAARLTVTDGIGETREAGLASFVRLNGWRTGYLLDDIDVMAQAQPTGFILPKVASVDDVRAADIALAEAEIKYGLPVGRIELVPILESARAKMQAYDIAMSAERVRRCVGGPNANPNGDSVRAVGYEWSAGGLETLYIDSKLVLEARAAGLVQVFGGMSASIHDLDLLRRTATRARQLGVFGSMVIHPSHVAVVNEVFAPRAEQVAEAVALLAAMESAVRRGDAAVMHDGRMVDIAHARTAYQLVRTAQASGVGNVELPEFWIGEFGRAQ
jgi:citrate lyase subunit beta/citryl-CoA lyase